jgi:glycosyltransferase involved in cell wall biosynthesis
MDVTNRLKKLKVAIVTHVFATGPAQELEEYLKERVLLLIFIGHPFTYAKNIRSFYKIYYKGQLIEDGKAPALRLPEICIYLKDVFYTLFWIVSRTGQLDIYVGADPLNALSGIILKKIGKVKKIIFYTIDFTPRRFNNRALNWCYHKIDSFCVRNCDFVWNLSKRMVEARRKKRITKTDNQLVVPIGVSFERIKRLNIKDISKNHLVFMGHLKVRQGLELVIDSLPDIIKKIPTVKLIIIGGGELENYLQEQVERLALNNHVEFKGYVEDHKEVEEILVHCGIGLATYQPHPDSVTWYADSSKPKQYMACGLPVIITKVSHIAVDVESKILGLVIDYGKESFVNAALKLLHDDEFYTRCRNNAVDYAAQLKWETIFDKALMACI